MKIKSLLPDKFFSQRISYKLFVTICISILISLFTVIMVANSFMAIRSNSLEMSGKEAQLTTDQMVSEVEDKLESLHQYYLYSAMDEDIEWFLNNKLGYSDYARYKQISNALGNNSLFPNQINSYVIINFDNGRVISSRGIYEIEEMYNGDEIRQLFEDNTQRVNRGNWVYIPDGTKSNALSARYRLTADTKGLNFVLSLPIGIFTPKGFMQVNINMDEWKRWIWNEIDISGRYVAVVDQEGNVIYSTDSGFGDECSKIALSGSSFAASRMDIDKKSFIVAKSDSKVLGWSYFVAYDYNTFLGATLKLFIEFLIAVCILAALSFITVSYAIYQPVDRLMKEVVESNDSNVEGNELQFLAGKFENLKTDKNEKREKLAELFEMRIIRSAVSSEDEWREYVKVLNLTEHPFYAAIAIILNLNVEENADDEINEDAICLELVEHLPEDLRKLPWLPLIYDSCTLTCLFAGEAEDELMEKISLYYDKIKEYALASCGYSIQMGVSEVHTTRKHLGRAYHECIYAITRDSEAGEKESACFYIKPSSTSGDEINLRKYEKDLTDALKSLDKGTCYRLIDEFTDHIKLTNEWNVASVYLTSLIDTVLIQALNMEIDVSSLWPEGLQKLTNDIVEVGDISRVRKNLKKLLVDPVFKARFELLEDHSYQMMAQIEKKLADSKGNITLNQCADELKVTPTYIWKVMKAERGKTFSEYQEEYKIEEAKKLLQTNMSVSDIASELGYTNAQNFIRFFSKGTGLTPGKYRKLMYGSV